MQKKVLIFSITIVVVGFIVFGFVSMESVKVKKELALTTTEAVITDDESKTVIPLKEENLFYSVGHRYKLSITHEKLKNARLIRDLIPDYPVNWIFEYDAVELVVIANNVETKTASKNEVLTEEQRMLFNMANKSDAIYCNVKYKVKNSVSDELVSREMNVSIAVVPDTPAEYIGGYAELKDYLKAGSAAKIVGKPMETLTFTRLDFVINTEGSIEQIRVRDSSGDTEVDKVLVKLLSEMPTWKPAKNVEGDLVDQKLEFILTYSDNNC